MSFQKEMLAHPVTGEQEQAWGGFSWPNLFFGVFWFIYKRLYLYGLLALVAVTLTGGFAWFVFPFFANHLHRDALLKDGWQLAEDVSKQIRCPDCREIVRSDAKKCKHCGSRLQPTSEIVMDNS